jgi:YgiT-type zinc finger domain-containing protein
MIPALAGLSAKAAAMECVICKRGETHPGTATVTVNHNSTVLVMKGVPADICTYCGEEYVGEATTAHLLRTAEEMSRAGVEVDVRKYGGP